MQKREGAYLSSLTFAFGMKHSSCFSPLHIPSTLNSPPSSSLMSHVYSKLCATQALEMGVNGN